MSKIPWKKFKYSDLLVVYWNDIVSIDEWISVEEAKVQEPLSCVSVGWLLDNSKEVVRLASTAGGDDNTNVIIIPEGVITKIVKVEYDRD